MRAAAFVLAVSGFALVPGALSAQACIGLPSSDGQIGVAFTGTAIDGEMELGGEFRVDVTGPAAFRIEYGNGHDDGIGRTYAALASYDFFLLEPSICGVAGVSYTTDPQAGIDDRLGLSVGFGLGKTLEMDRFSTTVYAIPQYVRVRDSLAGSDESVSANEFMAEAGVTLGFEPLYVGGAVVLSSVGDGEPGFRFRVGLLF